jgi:hypothetical protein
MKTTPQNYHLTHGPVLRDRLAKQYEQALKKMEADERADARRAARAATTENGNGR